MNEELIEFNGMIDNWGYQRSNLKWKLDKCKGKKVRCRVNSPGGNINEALVISQMFADHGDVTVEFVGFVGSAATFMVFGAKCIKANSDSFWLGHKSSMVVDIYKSMNADQLEETIKQLQTEKKTHDAIDLMIASKYYNRCKKKGKSLEDVFALMKENRWMTAQEAFEWGFVDEIVTGNSYISKEDKARMMQNCADLNLPLLPESNGAGDAKTAEELVNGFWSRLKDFFENKNVSPKNQETTMKKEFKLISALLGVTALQAENNKALLDEQQLQSIEDRLAAYDKLQNELKEAEEKLNKVGEKIAKMATIAEKANAVAELAANMPGVEVQAPVVPENNAPGVENFAQDEVMSFLEERSKQSIF